MGLDTEISIIKNGRLESSEIHQAIPWVKVFNTLVNDLGERAEGIVTKFADYKKL